MLGDIFGGIFDSLQGAVSSVGDFFDRGISLLSGDSDNTSLSNSTSNATQADAASNGLLSKLGSAGKAALVTTSSKSNNSPNFASAIDTNIRQSNSHNNYQSNSRQGNSMPGTDFEAWERTWMDRMSVIARLVEDTKTSVK